jgi:sugar/nucleoside kinase (ribokinase family)
MFLNEREFNELDQSSGSVFSRIEHVCAEKTRSRDVVVKMGSQGSIALLRPSFDAAGVIITTPAEPVEVVDTCGAGDAFLAAYASNVGRVPDLQLLSEANSWAGSYCSQRIEDR